MIDPRLKFEWVTRQYHRLNAQHLHAVVKSPTSVSWNRKLKSYRVALIHRIDWAGGDQ